MFWMGANRKETLWSYGTQPILLLLAAVKGWTSLDARWNEDGLGWRSDMPKHLVDSAYALHWSGANKPWLPKGLHRDTWLQYSLPACSAHGICQHGGVCICTGNWRGALCDEETSNAQVHKGVSQEQQEGKVRERKEKESEGGGEKVRARRQKTPGEGAEVQLQDVQGKGKERGGQHVHVVILATKDTAEGVMITIRSIVSALAGSRDLAVTFHVMHVG